MKNLSILSLFAALLFASSCAFSAEKPNILIILADDLGYGDLGYTGSKDIETPNLDALAKAGVILTDAHTTASVCAPSRAGLLSGRYQQRVGFECNGPHGSKGLPGDTYTYADGMKDAGYETMVLGKWHVGATEEMHPNAQGFDHFSGFTGGSRSYWATPAAKGTKMLQRNGVKVDEAKEVKYVTDWLTDEAIDLIAKREKEKPFFMFLSYTAPHAPMHARPEDLKKYESIENKGRRTYAAMVDRFDYSVGRVIANLKEQGIYDNTMIIFASDNGGATVNSSDNGIYRGMKGSKWEGGHRVPCIISWPNGKLGNGKKLDLLSSTLDFMATSLDAAGRTEVIEEKQLDGISLLPALRENAQAERGDLLFFRRSVAAGVRDGSWKLIRVEELDKSFRYLLFNLAEDIGETKNLAETQPDKVKDLAAKLAEWEKTVQEPKWLEGKNYQNNQRLKHKMSVIGRAAERKLP